MDQENLKNLLIRNGLKPNFTYGQNFLVDDAVLDGIISAAQISASDQILEVGPGFGNLTRKLCERAGFVLSLEKDPKFLLALKAIKKDFPKNFRFEIADALEFNYLMEFETWNLKHGSTSNLRDSFYKVVANIPYYITGKILEMLMTATFKPSSIIILTQKEVAERIVAKAGSLSVLAISVQIFGAPKIISFVPSKAFYPEPKVDSAILHIQLYKKSKFNITDEKSFFRLIKACFAGKRKQIHNTLVNNLKLGKYQVQKALSNLEIDPKSRPQELTIDNWVKLSNQIFN
ncbi:MAG: ribosomal RNA small subunit methyltransferase A [Candidatus Doudnabacteria bacterium]|nr:ribosomal RNA small subunit methyltransferase A [Candidatus Doudnabacteria bacterium]